MSLATAEKINLPDRLENDNVRLEQIGDVVCRLDSQRQAVIADYEIVCKSIRSELRRTTSEEEVVNRQFDLAMVSWLRDYFSRERPDRDLPRTLVFECQEAPPTTWLGGFVQLQTNFINMALNSAGLYDPAEAPELIFEAGGQRLEPYYPSDSQQWWRQNGSLVV